MAHGPSETRTDSVIACLIAFVSFWVFWLSPVHQVTDSNYSLLLSESLISHRTFTLDQYAIPRYPPLAQDYALKNGELYHLEWVRGRLFYFFPPGSSVLSVPFVGIMKLFGLSPANPDGTYNQQIEIKLEALLAAILMALAAALFFLTSRLLLPIATSLLVAFAASLGTQVWSTASRALWSDTWGILLFAVVIYQLLRSGVQRSPIQPEALATLLAWTYFVRPTSNIPILAITVYVALFHRDKLPRFLITGAIWLALFIAYSWHYFGKWMPNYYLARRLSFNIPFEALAGHLISPSRGLLLYVPVLLFVIWLLLRYRKEVQQRRLLWLSIAVVVVHIVIICGFDHWWGGFCYGPRLLASLVPWFVLLAILGLKAAQQNCNKKELAAGVLLLTVSILINARGAMARETWIWNTVPVNVDERPDRLWSWCEPQMLAGLIRPSEPSEFPLLSGIVEFSKEESAKYLWYGWSGAEQEARWTDGHEAAVVFGLTNIVDHKLEMKLGPYLVEGRHDRQRLQLDLNGTTLESVVLASREPVVLKLALPATLLRKRNVLTLIMPDAASPSVLEGKEDLRYLGVAVSWVRLDANQIEQN